MASPSVTARPVGRPAPDLHRRLLLSGILFGVGVAAFVDEVVLHQLLHWHHFYDLSTAAVGLVSDGLFHAFGWFAAVAGLFLFADVRRRGGPGVGRWWPAVLIGAVLAAVHHAEVVAHRVGEPFGTLLLTLSVTVIEVALIEFLRPEAKFDSLDALVEQMQRDEAEARRLLLPSLRGA